MKYFYQNTFLILFLGLFISGKSFAQEKVILGEYNGVEVSYMLQYLGTDEKKNANKSRDEYQLTTYAINKKGSAIYSTSSIVAGCTNWQC